MHKLQVINTNPRRLLLFNFTVNCEMDSGDITLETSDFNVNKMKEARRNKNLLTRRLLMNIFG